MNEFEINSPEELYLENSNQELVLLFIGLACSGKSSVAKKLAKKLREESSLEVDIFSGDAFLKEFSIKQFDQLTRMQLAPIIINKIRNIFQSRRVIENDRKPIIVVVDKGNPLAEERILFQESFDNIIQVYFSCPIYICIWRDILRSLKKESPLESFIYLRVIFSLLRPKNKRRYLQGINVPFEIPTDADIVIPHEVKADHAVSMIIHELIKKKYVF